MMSHTSTLEATMYVNLGGLSWITVNIDVTIV